MRPDRARRTAVAAPVADTVDNTVVAAVVPFAAAVEVTTPDCTNHWRLPLPRLASYREATVGTLRLPGTDIQPVRR